MAYPAEDPGAASGQDPASGAGRRPGRSGRSSGKSGRSSGQSGRPAPAAPEGDREADPFEVARAIVLRQLTHSPKSRLQLEAKLAERHVPPEVAEQVLDRFEEVQLVDDAEFARMWVRSRIRTKHLARGALRRELAEKGISGETAEDALAQSSEEEERRAARDLVERRLPRGADLQDRAERDRHTRRLVAMLARKGYPSGMAFEIVREILDGQAEDGGYGSGDW